MNEEAHTTKIAYIGPAGGGFGFELAGVQIYTSSTGVAMLQQLREIAQAQTFGIIFIDEGLAQDVLDEMEDLNRETLPAIVLLPNPSNPKRTAARRLEKLMVTAVGSDIFND